MLLLARHATVTYCHSRTVDVARLVADVDIVVAAVGKPRFVQGEWLKPGAVVIDAGYNPGNIGDVDFEGAAQVASLITPVPGGVGPMTALFFSSKPSRQPRPRGRPGPFVRGRSGSAILERVHSGAIQILDRPKLRDLRCRVVMSVKAACD